MKKWLCLVLGMVLALSALALAESAGEDLQAQLDAANARIVELEAEVEKYRPYYDSQVVAEYGEDGVIWLEDAQAQYDQIANMYAQYGMDPSSMDPSVKQMILEGLVQTAVQEAKIKELGFDQLDEQTTEDLTAKANEDLENYVSYYRSYFAAEDASDEEAREATIAGLAQAGVTQESLLEDRVKDYATEQLHDYVTKDVTVSEDEVKAAYDAKVAEDQESFEGSDFDYNSARSGGQAIAWNPEGYRAVKHVLVKFDDEQTKRYTELQDLLSSLNDEMAALDKAEASGEDEASAEIEAAEETAEEAAEEGAETEETVEAPRAREEIQADIEAADASLQDLYDELMPKAQEVIDAFHAGTDIDTLMEQYGEDPGMTREPTKTEGYAVSADSTYWEPAFTEGAMAIAEIGQISEPVCGSNGIHIIYYMSDITPGAVPYEDIRDAVEASALEAKVSETFNNQVAAWVEEANVVYHLDRF